MAGAADTGRAQAAPGLFARAAALGPTYGALAALLALILVNAIFTPNFATAQNLWNILLQVSTTVLVAVGMTMVIATGGIDLSVGSVMAMASALCATTLDRGVGFAVVSALALAVAVGAFNGALISGFRIQPIIVTLALLITGRGAAQVMSEGGQLIPFSNATFELLGRGRVGPIPVQVLIMLVVFAGALFLMRGANQYSPGFFAVNVNAALSGVISS